METIIKQEPIRTEYSDGTIVISNIRDPRTNEATSFTVTNIWHDGTPMTDAKVDSFGVFTKLRETGEYVRRNLPNWGENFLIVDDVPHLRMLDNYQVHLLKVGYYKGIELRGYHSKGDKKASIVYYLSNTSQLDNGGSVFAIGDIKVEHNFGGFLNILYWGAKGDGVFDNKEVLERVWANAKTRETIYVPIGRYLLKGASLGDLTKYGIRTVGESHEASEFVVDERGIRIKSAESTWEKIKFTGVQWESSSKNPYYCFTDAREINTADLDIAFYNCQFLYFHGVVKTRGRGVIFDKMCFFYEIYSMVMDLDFPTQAEFQKGTTNPSPIFDYDNAMRGFIFHNNRMHYCGCYIITCNKNNAVNARGISIQNNWIEGAAAYFSGYANDMVVKGNNHYQAAGQDAFTEGLFVLLGGKNIDIDINICSVKDNGANMLKPKSLLVTYGSVENLKIRGNIDGLRNQVCRMNNGGKNIDIQLNARNFGLSSPETMSFATISGGSYEGVRFAGRIQSTGPNFIAVSRNRSISTGVVDLDLSGLKPLGTYNKLYNSFSLSDIKPKEMISYLGDGVETGQVIQIRYEPKAIKIVDPEGKMLLHTRFSALVNSPNITLSNVNPGNSIYITVKGPLNTLNAGYYLEYE